MENFHNCSFHNEIIPVEPAKLIAKTQFHIIETVTTTGQGYFKPNLICNACLTGDYKQTHILDCQKLIGSNE